MSLERMIKDENAKRDAKRGLVGIGAAVAGAVPPVSWLLALLPGPNILYIGAAATYGGVKLYRAYQKAQVQETGSKYK